MFTHVVLFKFRESSPDVVGEVAAQAQERLLGMRGRVPSLRDIEVGIDVLRTDRSFDLCLITRFGSRADLAAYQQHPVHQDVLAWLRQVISASHTVDYEGGLFTQRGT